MTFSCTDCSRCGKCYDKNSTCPSCGGAINLLDDFCHACLEPITEEMRDRAKQAYLDEKKVERDRIIALASAAKERRLKEGRQGEVVYPWDAS